MYSKCVKCHRYAFTIKKRWYAGKGKEITARLCASCAKELDDIYISEYNEAKKEKNKLMRKIERILDKEAKKKWQRGMENIKR